MQNPVGENMTTLTITGKLHLVNGDKVKPAIGKFGIGIGIKRHRFNRAAKIARTDWQDTFFACQQPNLANAKLANKPVIIFPRQKPQWKADHAAGIAGHAFKRQMGFTGVGRAKNQCQVLRRMNRHMKLVFLYRRRKLVPATIGSPSRGNPAK